jgi:hypothetical protein
MRKKGRTLDFTESTMGYLTGLSDYLDNQYGASIFDRALADSGLWNLHVHGQRVIAARIIENLIYDIKIEESGKSEQILPKIQVKFLYPIELTDAVGPLIKLDPKVKALKRDPIIYPHQRYFVKNKTLFPLMQEKQVVFVTLLEGEVVRGLVAGFSRYDLTMHLKGGKPLTILRHSILDVRDKKGRCYLKSFQEVHKDWIKSNFYQEDAQIP